MPRSITSFSRRALFAGLGSGAVCSLTACWGAPGSLGQRGAPPNIRVGLPISDYASSQATALLLQPLLNLSKRPPAGGGFTVEPVVVPPAPTPQPAADGSTMRPELVALQKVLTDTNSAAADMPPDVVLLVTADDAIFAGAKGLIRPVDSYLAMAPTAKRDAFYAGALGAVTAGGHVWGFPLAFSPQVTIYDPGYLTGLGVTLPTEGWDWQQFAALSTALTNPAAKRYALGPFDYLPAYIYQGGGSVLNAEGTQSALKAPGAVAGINFYADLAQRRKVVAPSGPCRTGPPHVCGDDRIGWELVSPTNTATPLAAGSRYAPPLLGKVTATAGSVSYILAITSHAADAASAFSAIVAIADAVQPTLVMPSRRAIAQQQPTTPLYFSDQTHQMALAAAEVARGEPLDQSIRGALGQLQVAIRQGAVNPGQATTAAATTIDRILADRHA